MAGAKKNGMVRMGVMAILLLVVTTAASFLASPTTALRDPFVGLSIGGGRLEQPPRPSLSCCDDCRCRFNPRGPPCMCLDRFRLQDRCPRGCMRCVPNDQWWTTFSCVDMLQSCPRRCSCRSPAAPGAGDAGSPSATTSCTGDDGDAAAAAAAATGV